MCNAAKVRPCLKPLDVSSDQAGAQRRHAVARWLLLVWVTLASGCAEYSRARQAMAAPYQPSNVHRAESSLPRQIKRVGVLPVTTLTEEAVMEFGRESLGPVLVEELGRARLFEVVVISPEELRAITGRSAWSGEEKLPLDFFERLREKLGLDAVLFARLTQYRAYEPLSVGWRLKLLDTEEPRIVWAVDEVFDSRVPGVAAAARRFAAHLPAAGGEAEDVLSSPRRFGRYTASAVFATIPGRAADP